MRCKLQAARTHLVIPVYYKEMSDTHRKHGLPQLEHEVTVVKFQKYPSASP